MLRVESSALAIAFCALCMAMIGSWLVPSKVLGHRGVTSEVTMFYVNIVVFLISVIGGFSIGSVGDSGQNFVDNLESAAGWRCTILALGGSVLALANVTMSICVTYIGLSTAVPMIIGMALCLGTLLNYFIDPENDPAFLFPGVFFAIVALVVTYFADANKVEKEEVDLHSVVDDGSMASQDAAEDPKAASDKRKGLILAVIGGLLSSIWAAPVLQATKREDSDIVAPGEVTEYTGFFYLALGNMLATVVTFVVFTRYSVSEPVSFSQLRVSASTFGLVSLGGLLLGGGNILFLLAAPEAGGALAYAFMQSSTFIASCWGIFVFREYAGATTKSKVYLFFMFVAYAASITLLSLSNSN